MQTGGLKEFWDVVRLLRGFGAYIYTGDRRADILLMETELKDLYTDRLIVKEDYLAAVMLLRKELADCGKRAGK